MRKYHICKERIVLSTSFILRLVFSLMVVGSIIGCTSLSFEHVLPPEPTGITLPTQTPSPTMTPELQIPSPEAQPLSLRLWLPPEFNPGGENKSGKDLQARLSEFQQRQKVYVEVRVKGLEGEGGIINSLTSANAAAPLALPDVVALSQPLLEKAALKGLLYPYENDTIIKRPDWYEYTRQLAQIQESTYGIPFAGDALVLAYRKRAISKPPRSWEAVLAIQYPFMFAASDSESLFPIALYMASGGTFQDEQGKPNLDLTTLTKVFTFIEQAQRGDQMPYWLTQYEKDSQVWQAFLDNRSPMAITWLSQAQKYPSSEVGIGLLPSPTGDDFCLIRGWSWALTSPEIEKRALASELVQFLTESEFTSRWSQTAGYFPPQSSALNEWEDEEMKQLTSRMIMSGKMPPSTDLLTIISPLFKDNINRILKNQSNASSAALDIMDKLKSP